MNNKHLIYIQNTGKGVREFVFKHLKTNTILVLSFLFVILVGTLLLMLPISSTKAPISFIDALFNATSATCVTGLVTITPIEDLTLFGQLVVLAMIQIGGLGFMTIVSVILLFMKNKLSFKERALLKEGLNKDSFNNIGDYIFSIAQYTFVFELIGALILYGQFSKNGDPIYALFQAIFLSISAFCNAGIDILGSTSLIPYQSNIVVNLTISSLIIFGGLGFAVWFDMRNKIFTPRILRNAKAVFHRFKLHTKIVLITTSALIVSGFLFILFFEWNHALVGLSPFDKIMAAYFNSVTLRTAGFATLDYATLQTPTKLIMIIYMLIGGSPGGTAGGMKTTTFFIIVFAIVQQLRGTDVLNFKGREIPKRNFGNATIIFVLYLLVYLSAVILLTGFENIPLLDLLFEAASALGTVGLSTGITTALSSIGKIIIIMLMFIGRLGPVSIILLLARKKSSNKGIRYPISDILVG